MTSNIPSVDQAVEHNEPQRNAPTPIKKSAKRITKKRVVRSSPSADAKCKVLVSDPLFNFGELRDRVEDTVKLLLSAYFISDTVEYPNGIGTDDDPVLVEVLLAHSEKVSYKFRQPAGAYYAEFNSVFHIACQILAVYGRAYLLVFPSQEKYLSRSEIFVSLVHWTLLACEDNWVQEVKNRLLTAFSRSEKQPEPDFKTCHHRTKIFLGKFGSYAVRDMHGGGRARRIWRNTVLHGVKKGMPSVSSKFIEKALKKHGALLAQEGGSHEEFNELVSKCSDIIFRDVQLEPPKLGHKVSHNACYENTRSNGGAFDELSAWSPSKALSRTTWLVLMDYRPKWSVFEVRTNQFESNVTDRTLTTRGSTLWNVEVIREPLKVRCITAGEQYRNAAWSDVQKSLWRSLQRFKCFCLTGGEDVRHAILNMPQILSRTTSSHWCSGDYQAATDSIYGDVMESALSGIKDPLLVNLLMDNLSNGEIHYEGICNRLGIEVVPAVEQKRGQLMGSIFSFPILCVINLATYLATAFRFQKNIFGLGKVTLEDAIKNAPVLINGDDILFESPSRRFTEVWEYNSKCAGFNLSVGKTYYSKNFALVNSTYFQISSMECIPYVNMGILYGKKKGDGDSRIGPVSMREKMASLPGYFHDLFKWFKRSGRSAVIDANGELRQGSVDDAIRTDRAIAKRLEVWAWNARTDVRWSKWSKEILGLNFTGTSQNWEKYLTEIELISGKVDNSYVNTRSSHQDSLIWSHPGEIDTSILYRRAKVQSQKSPSSCRLLSRIVQDYWAIKEQDEIDCIWLSTITPNYRHVLL